MSIYFDHLFSVNLRILLLAVMELTALRRPPIWNKGDG